MISGINSMRAFLFLQQLASQGQRCVLLTCPITACTWMMVACKIMKCFIRRAIFVFKKKKLIPSNVLLSSENNQRREGECGEPGQATASRPAVVTYESVPGSNSCTCIITRNVRPRKRKVNTVIPAVIRSPYLRRNYGHIREVAFCGREK